jgi:hypothetical protein
MELFNNLFKHILLIYLGWFRPLIKLIIYLINSLLFNPLYFIKGIIIIIIIN